jgi:hypothetical protein
MDTFNTYMNEYKAQLKRGYIQKAYKGLIDYIMELKLYLKNNYPDYLVSGNIYTGYMDMTYFSFFPESLKRLKLKTGIIFIHEAFRFEAWLYGYNKDVQAKYWKLIRESSWSKYRIPSTIRGVDSIMEHTLVDNPDFSDLDTLTKRIEEGMLNFIYDVESFLSEH